MIAPTSIQQPIAVITQAQLPLDALRVDNHQLPKVPQPAKLFPSSTDKEPQAKGNLESTTKHSSATTNSNHDSIVTAKDSSENGERGNSDTASDKDDHQQELEVQNHIQQLANRDREVRAHERAHSSVGGQFAGSPHFVYEKGPNGVLYAVSGEVSISTSQVAGDSDASIAKLETVIRAALAPAVPSSQDLRVAASASTAIQNLRTEAFNTEKELKVAQADSEDEEDIKQNITPQDNLQQKLKQRLENTGVFLEEESEGIFSSKSDFSLVVTV